MEQRDTFRGLIGDVIEDATTLVRQELRLAQTEAVEKLAEAQNRMIVLIAGLLLGFCALLILLQAVVAALATVMAPWLASVIVGLVLVIAAVALIKYGQGDAADLKPRRTIRSLKKDKDMVAENVS
jgi:hypothetical protein